MAGSRLGTYLSSPQSCTSGPTPEVAAFPSLQPNDGGRSLSRSDCCHGPGPACRQGLAPRRLAGGGYAWRWLRVGAGDTTSFPYLRSPRRLLSTVQIPTDDSPRSTCPRCPPCPPEPVTCCFTRSTGDRSLAHLSPLSPPAHCGHRDLRCRRLGSFGLDITSAGFVIRQLVSDHSVAVGRSLGSPARSARYDNSGAPPPSVLKLAVARHRGRPHRDGLPPMFQPATSQVTRAGT